MVSVALPCLNQTEYECIKARLTTFSIQDKERCDEQCPHECDSVEFHLTQSSLDYPNRDYFEFLIARRDVNASLEFLNISVDFDSYRRSSLALDIFIPRLEYTVINQKPKLTLFDLFAQVGGALGMLLSMSIFTCIEFVELVSLFIYSMIFHKK